MKQLRNYSDENLNLLKEKMEEVGIKFDVQIIFELLRQLEKDVQEVELKNDGRKNVIGLGKTEYFILTDEQADDMAWETVQEEINDWGLEYFDELNLLAYMDEDQLEELAIDQLEWWIHGASEEDILEEMTRVGAETVDELIEKRIEGCNVMDYLLSFYDEKELASLLLQQGGIDVEAIIEDVISWYGRERYLATYDHEEIKLITDKGTYYAYRIS